MSRYATIITDDDGREAVSAIGEFEGAAPQARLGRVEPVAAVCIRSSKRNPTETMIPNTVWNATVG